MHFKTTVIGIGFLLTSALLGAELSPAARLRKLSFHLRGKAPALAEYAALEKAVAESKAESFFGQTTQTYLKTPEHVGKTIARLDELFRLKAAAGLPETRLVTPTTAPFAQLGNETYNTLDLVFQRMAQENLSWDELLLAKSYPVPAYSTAGDLDFYRSVATELPQNPEKPEAVYDISFAKEDPRVGGVITTGRFFKRYNTTNINRSRGRAAAVFRIFLCDDMRALVEPKPGEDEELLKKAFPPKKPGSGDDELGVHATYFDEDVHGKDPACMACHYKLDPLGRAFFPIGTAMNEVPGPGRLVYRRADGTLVDIAGRGLGDLAAAIAVQPEYASCQVKHFWNWFIRRDEAPSKERLEALVKKFNELGRRTNDFIAYLVNEPEFRTVAVETPSHFLKVKPTLERCASCHAGTLEKIPDFTVLPLGNSADHVYWLTRIVRRLDLKNGGKDKTMPPKESAWQPNAEELTGLVAWIRERAPDEKGKPTIDAATAAELLKPSNEWLDGIKGPQKTFKETLVRYVGGQDMLRVFLQSFPGQKVGKAESREYQCQSLTDKNRGLLGDNNPANGEPSYRAPSASFVKWYTKCVWLLAAADLETSLAAKKMEPYFGEEALKLLAKEPYANVVQEPKAVRWRSLSAPIRRAIALWLLQRYIGPRIVPNEVEVAAKLGEGLERMPDVASTYDALRKSILFVTSQESFLTY